MSEWLDFSVRLEGDRAFLALLPVAGALAYLIYQRTHPAVDPVRRIALAAMRGAAMALILLMLAEPVLGLWSKQVVYPLFLLLVDTSPSMGTEEEGIQRLAQVKEVLEHEDWRERLAPAEVQAWGFAGEPYDLSLDTVSVLGVNGQATDLSSALEKSLEQVYDHKNLQGVIIFSDGRHNLGQDPVRMIEEYGVPLYALVVGSEENPADIQIVQVRAEEVGYVGHDLEIEVEVRTWGYAHREVVVQLYEGEEKVDQQRVVLQGDALIQHASFSVVSKDPGPHIYRVFIAPEEGEFSRDNNEALVFTRVLEERIQALLIAGAPSPDLAFLQRSLEADSHILVQALVQKKDGAFYQEGINPEDVLEGKDVLVLLNARVGALRDGTGPAIREHVRTGGGLLFIGGSKSFQDGPDASVAEVLSALIEGVGKPFVSQEISLQLSPEGRHHPVVRLQAADKEGDPWAQLPPLPGYFPIARKRQGAIILVEGSGPHTPPVLVAGSYGQGKVVVGLSAFFWRLDLLSSGVGGRPQTIRQFWQDAVKWLAIRTPAGRVRASTERHIYRAGEQVVFAAQVFDELLRPQEAATVQIALEGEDLGLQLQEQGGGHYLGRLSGLEPGDYRYTARVYDRDVLIGEDEGRLLVEQHSIESVDVRVDKVLLDEMARVSGGRSLPLAAWRGMLDLLAPQKRLAEEAKVFPLWGQNGVLVWVIVLLAVEWIVRKRSGMI